MFHNKYMQRAISCALSSNIEVPVAALIVDKVGEVLAESSNKTKEKNDPTAHAEIIAIKDACMKVGKNQLNDCSIYVTLEPCAMCAAAISYARIENIYYGSIDQKFGAIDSNIQIFQSNLTLYKPNVYAGIMEQECLEIIQGFFQGRRRTN